MALMLLLLARKYADDVSFVHFIRCYGDDDLQSEWDSLVKWSSFIRRPLDYDKSCVMNVAAKKVLHLLPISINDPLSSSGSSCLQQVDALRFLGINFPNDLKWNVHFDNIAKKAFKRLLVIRNLRRAKCPPNQLLQSYAASIRFVMIHYPVF